MPSRFPGMDPYLGTVYPLRLPEPLPTIAIPLLPGDPAVSLDLQAVFDRTYDAGPYRREIDYRTAPPNEAQEQKRFTLIFHLIFHLFLRITVACERSRGKLGLSP